jgi:CubicO group peptidase (beta-lactamase class C family)
MQMFKNLSYVILASALVIFGQGIIGSNFGSCIAMDSALYQNLQADAFMKTWLILGPIPVFPEKTDSKDEELQKKAFANDFLAQNGGESGIAPKDGMTHQIDSKEYKWQTFTSKDDIIDLTAVFGKLDYVVAYAWAEIDSSEAKDVLLGVGSDDSVKVWLNGKLINEKWIGRGVNKDDDLIQAKLQKGKNQILFKVQNMEMAWGFCCRILGKESLTEKLISAAGIGNLDDIEMLLSNGADVNAIGELGLTALHKATMSGRKDAVDLLIKKGADPNIKMPDKEKLADAVFNKVIKGNSPGASVLVAKDGKIIYQKAFGYADVGNHVPFTPETKSRIGSITKQFIASAILKLQEEGKISVNDKLSKFIPDFPRGDEVTIHHLLTHTSGIHSFTSKLDFMKNVTVEIKPEDMINSIKKDPYDFNPGEKWLYNNSGYFILGYIIEKITGEPYENYLKKTFFDPLGMKDTGVHNSHTIYEHEAYGYSYDGKFQKAINWDMSQAGGAGSIYSTVGDLYRWNEGIFNEKVLSKASLDSAFTPVKLNDGIIPKDIGGGYGYGWVISNVRGLKEIQHGGGLDGFNSQILRFPELNITVAVLQNCLMPPPGMSATELANPVVEIYFWDKMGAQESVKVDKTISSSKYDDYVGRYDYAGTIMKIRKDGDRLLAQLAGQPEYEIFPKSENEFFWKVVDAQVTFVKNEKGEVTHVLHHQGGMEYNVPKLKDETSAKVDPAIYDQYVGEYSLNIPQIEAIKVTKEGDKLFAQATGQPKIELFPRSESEFFSDIVVMKVNFVKDDQGKVTKIVINQSGITIEGAKK